MRKTGTQLWKKMVMNKYLWIITLNESGLNDPIKKQNTWTDNKAWATCMLLIRDSPENKRPKETESGGLEKNIPRKWRGKKNMG